MALKQDILRILEQNRGQHLSGEMLAAQQGVTRAAVWKAIQALQADGHQINATPARGYQLALESDRLSPEGIGVWLTQPALASQFQVFATIDSTNSELKRQAAHGAPHGTVLVADEQTAGRGRLGRSFYSPAKSGLYLSVLLRPQQSIQDAQLVTVFAAVVASEAIEQVTGLPLQIKWVNDLYLGSKKVSGILTESTSDFESGQVESLIIGLGLNVSGTPDQFPEDLRDRAGFLSVGWLNRNRLAAAIAEALLSYSPARPEPDLLDRYRRRSWLTGKEVSYYFDGRLREGTVTDISEQGNLVIRNRDGSEHQLHSGEVQLLKFT